MRSSTASWEHAPLADIMQRLVDQEIGNPRMPLSMGTGVCAMLDRTGIGVVWTVSLAFWPIPAVMRT